MLFIANFGLRDLIAFSNIVRTFLASAQAANKTKLMIDLRGNPGGIVSLAYDLFAQLFPQIYPYGTTNFRAGPILTDIGQIISQEYANITSATASVDGCTSFFSEPPFNYHEMFDKDEHVFSSLKDYYGPYEHHGDNFTGISRFNLADKYAFQCVNISNYGPLLNITPQVFRPEDIVIVQDGACASTCAVFGEFIKTQASVSQIVFGGRKQFGPMQAIGGVKGASVYGFDVFETAIEFAVEEFATPSQRERFDKTYDYETLTNTTMHSINRAAPDPNTGKAAKVNSRNNIRLGDDTVTPLQFIYEAVDCRLFYTAEMISHASPIWKAAYAARWGDGECVEGSTGHLSSKQGISWPNTPPANARYDATDYSDGV